MNVRQADKENGSKQQEEPQDSVNERLQDVTKTLQHNDNVRILSKTALLFACKYSFKDSSVFVLYNNKQLVKNTRE